MVSDGPHRVPRFLELLLADGQVCDHRRERAPEGAAECGDGSATRRRRIGRELVCEPLDGHVDEAPGPLLHPVLDDLLLGIELAELSET